MSRTRTLWEFVLFQYADSFSLNCRLELGAGGGLVGLAVAAGCDLQAPLILTDQDVMLELMRHNIQLNKLDSKATASTLDW